MLQGAALGVELLHQDEQVHVVGPPGLDPQVRLGVADHDGLAVEADGEGRQRRIGLGAVLRRRRVGRRLRDQGAGDAVEVILGVGDRVGREGLGGQVQPVAALEVVQGVADARRGLPPVVLALQIVVEEAAQVLDVGVVIVVRPFLDVVDAQPLLLRAHAAPSAEGAGRVQGVGVAGDDVGRDGDLLESGDLVFPERAHQRVALGLERVVLAQVLARIGAPQPLREAEVGHAAAHDQVPVDVAEALLRIDGGEVGRLLGCGEPLRVGEVGGAAHPDLAAAPVLDGQPLDQVVAVLPLLTPEHGAVAVGVGDAAGIGVADGVAVRAPVGGVGPFELLQARQAAGLHAEHGEEAHSGGRTALALAVRAPGHQDGRALDARRAQDIHIDGHPVAHRDRDILLEHDVYRQRAEHRTVLVTGRQCLDAGREGGGEAVLRTARIGIGRDEDLFDGAHGGS